MNGLDHQIGLEKRLSNLTTQSILMDCRGAHSKKITCNTNEGLVHSDLVGQVPCSSFSLLFIRVKHTSHTTHVW